MKPREVVAFQGWCVWGFGARVGAGVVTSGDSGADSGAEAAAEALARSTAA
jgi:hypothetical protein